MGKTSNDLVTAFNKEGLSSSITKNFDFKNGNMENVVIRSTDGKKEMTMDEFLKVGKH